MQTEVAFVEEPGVGDRFESHGNIKVDTVDVDEPGIHEVHVDMKSCGICHSDWHTVCGDLPTEHYPCALGHEGAGVIAEAGAGVEHVDEGDHVVLSWMPACGKCHYCAQGMQNHCVRGDRILTGRMMDGTFNMHRNGTDIGQYAYLGCFAKDVVVHKDSVVPIDDDVPFSVAGFTGCGIATGFGAAQERANIKTGDTVVVYGVGGLGISAVQGAALQGAGQVVAVDPVDFKREKAMELGATHTVNPEDQEAHEFVEDITNGYMADSAILTTSLATPGLEGKAYATIKNRGQLVSVAASAYDVDSIDVPEHTGGLVQLSMGGKEIKGALYGGWSPNYAIPRLLDLYKDGQLKLDELVTNTYELDEINDGFDDLLEGRNLRGVVEL